MKMLFGPMRLTPADFAAAMTHRAWAGSRDALQLHGRHHHNRNPAVAARTTEVSGQIRGECQIAVLGQTAGGLQDHMASRALLGMEPKVTTARLAQTDPVILSVVSPHLNQQASR